MAELTEVAALRAKVAELEAQLAARNAKEATLEAEVQTLLGICGGNYKLGEDFKKVCRKYYTKEFIQSCVGGDACPVGEYFDDHNFDDESVRYSEPGVEWKPEPYKTCATCDYTWPTEDYWNSGKGRVAFNKTGGSVRCSLCEKGVEEYVPCFDK